MSRVLIVGAGLTGSLCACLLRRELQDKVSIAVWDKARGAGGRMSTSRPPDSSSHSADLGAQYITATSAYAQSHHSFPWAARYVTDNPCICYVAADSCKRNADTPGRGPSLVVHTSVPFGLEHLEKDKEEVQPIILQELYKMLPGLPQPISIKCQKWRYSQVLTSVPDCPGQMTVLDRPLLVCGGDAFSHSNFDGCVESALSVLRVLKASLSGSDSTTRI
ncbi:Renalase [Larimichthys crocea]|nr:Renalase [Larimichthys crocea]